jgi:hypothetical protein
LILSIPKFKKDDFIGPIFNEKIGNSWPEHLEKCIALANYFT